MLRLSVDLVAHSNGTQQICTIGSITVFAFTVFLFGRCFFLLLSLFNLLGFLFLLGIGGSFSTGGLLFTLNVLYRLLFGSANWLDSVWHESDTSMVV
jgi:hypothetical protein